MFKHRNLFISVLLVTLIRFLEKQERQIRKLENSLTNQNKLIQTLQNSNKERIRFQVLSDKLFENEILKSNFYLLSENGQYKAILQDDGDLAVKRGNRNLYLLSVGTKKNLPFELRMQADGNLVLYNSLNTPVWSSKTEFNVSYPRLKIQNDGHLVLYDWKNSPFWGTGIWEYTVRIKNEGNGLCLGINSMPDVTLVKCDKNNHQMWVRVNYLDGYFTLMNKATGFYLTESDGSIYTTANDESKRQDWYTTDLFRNGETKKAFQIENSGTNYSIHQI